MERHKRMNGARKEIAVDKRDKTEECKERRWSDIRPKTKIVR